MLDWEIVVDVIRDVAQENMDEEGLRVGTAKDTQVVLEVGSRSRELHFCD
jgi:hypothetical protein